MSSKLFAILREYFSNRMSTNHWNLGFWFWSSPVKASVGFSNSMSLNSFICSGQFPTKSGASGQPSILWLLRDHFVNNVDADGSGHLSRDDLFEHIKESRESRETVKSGNHQLIFVVLWSLFLIRFRCVEHVLKISLNWTAVACCVSMCPASKKAKNYWYIPRPRFVWVFTVFDLASCIKKLTSLPWNNTAVMSWLCSATAGEFRRRGNSQRGWHRSLARGDQHFHCIRYGSLYKLI